MVSRHLELNILIDGELWKQSEYIAKIDMQTRKF